MHVNMLCVYFYNIFLFFRKANMKIHTTTIIPQIEANIIVYNSICEIVTLVAVYLRQALRMLFRPLPKHPQQIFP